MEKTCTNCANSYPRPDEAKYLLCRKAEGDGDKLFAAEMRQGACGPDAKLWEPRNG